MSFFWRLRVRCAQIKLPYFCVAVRRKEGWQAYDVKASSTRAFTALAPTAGNPVVASPCGRYLAALEGEQFTIYKLDATVANFAAGADGAPPVVHATLARRGIVGCVFSPRGTFVATFETPVKSRAGQPNLLVWDVASMECRLRLHQREWLPNTYGYSLQWTADESRFAHQRPASVAVYDGRLPLAAPEPVEVVGGAVGDESADGGDAAVAAAAAAATVAVAAAEAAADQAGAKAGGNQPVYVLGAANLVQFALAPNADANLLATFCKGVKGAPATMRLYDIASLSGANPSARVTKSIFAAERVELKWNALCTHLLMLCHTEVDATGASYGGGTQLFFFATDASFHTQVSFQEEGQVQAVEWKCVALVIGLFSCVASDIFSWQLNHRCAVSQSQGRRFHRDSRTAAVPGDTLLGQGLCADV